MQSAIRIFRAVGPVALATLSIALLDPLAAFAQVPQSKFAEVAFLIVAPRIAAARCARVEIFIPES